MRQSIDQQISQSPINASRRVGECSVPPLPPLPPPLQTKNTEVGPYERTGRVLHDTNHDSQSLHCSLLPYIDRGHSLSTVNRSSHPTRTQSMSKRRLFDSFLLPGLEWSTCQDSRVHYPPYLISKTGVVGGADCGSLRQSAPGLGAYHPRAATMRILVVCCAKQLRRERRR